MAAPTPVELREELKRLVDCVPDQELATARRFLEYLMVVHVPTEQEEREWEMWEAATDEAWAAIDADEKKP